MEIIKIHPWLSLTLWPPDASDGSHGELHVDGYGSDNSARIELGDIPRLIKALEQVQGIIEKEGWKVVPGDADDDQ